MLKEVLKNIIYRFRFRNNLFESLSYKNFNETIDFFSSKRSIYPKRIECPKKKRIIVLAPHPDDEVFGPGGTLFLSKKCFIKIIYLTSGRDEKEKIIREDEANKLCDYYKFQRVFLGHHQGFVTIDTKIKNKVEKIIKDFRADIVFTPFLTDDHQDHQNINKLFLDFKIKRNIKVWCYQIYSQLKGNFYVNITDCHKQKRRMIKFYKSEMRIRNWESFIMSQNVIHSRYMPKSPEVRFAEMYFISDIKFYKKLCNKFFKGQ